MKGGERTVKLGEVNRVRMEGVCLCVCVRVIKVVSVSSTLAKS